MAITRYRPRKWRIETMEEVRNTFQNELRLLVRLRKYAHDFEQLIDVDRLNAAINCSNVLLRHLTAHADVVKQAALEERLAALEKVLAARAQPPLSIVPSTLDDREKVQQ